MSRQSKPWYNRQRRCWMVWWGRRKVRLVDGERNRATKKLAEQRLNGQADCRSSGVDLLIRNRNEMLDVEVTEPISPLLTFQTIDAAERKLIAEPVAKLANGLIPLRFVLPSVLP